MEPNSFGSSNSLILQEAPTAGHFAWYELTHWGARPSVKALTEILIAALTREGVPYVGEMISLAVDEMLASSTITVGSIGDILAVTIAAADPATRAVIEVIAGIVVGF